MATYLGTAAVSITPKQFGDRSLSGFGRFRKCRGVHDLIYARIYVFADLPPMFTADKNTFPKTAGIPPSAIKLILINYDLTGFGYKNLLKLCGKVFDVTGINGNLIHVFSTHTHYAPDTEGVMPAPIWPRLIHYRGDKSYIDFVIRRTVEGILKALDTIITDDNTPDDALRIGVSYGSARFPGRSVRNRRPPAGVRHILHPDIHCIMFSNDYGIPIGLIVIFPSHPVIIPRFDNRISGGWPGFLARILKNSIENRIRERYIKNGTEHYENKGIIPVKARFVPLILQGPSGNVTAIPYYDFTEGDIKKIRSLPIPERWYTVSRYFARRLSEIVLKITEKINTFSKPVRISSLRKEVEIPLNVFGIKTRAGVFRESLFTVFKWCILLPVLTLFRGQVPLFINLKRSGKLVKDMFKPRLITPVTAIKFNNILILGNPGEPFYNTEKILAAKLEGINGIDKVIVAELCNDAIGYNWIWPAKEYLPETYDSEMSFSPLTGIITLEEMLKLGLKISVNNGKKETGSRAAPGNTA